MIEIAKVKIKHTVTKFSYTNNITKKPKKALIKTNTQKTNPKLIINNT